MSYQDTIRNSHYVRETCSDRTPTNLLFFDSETLPFQDPSDSRKQYHRLRLWCASHVRLDAGEVVHIEQEQGYEIEEFWEWVVSKSSAKHPLWLFAHNLHFDLTALGFYTYAVENVFDFRQEELVFDKRLGRERTKIWHGTLVAEDPPMIIGCRAHGSTKRVVMVDTFNWFRCSLKSLGDSIGVPKENMPDFNADDETWFNYCHTDVRVIQEAICKLIKLVKTERLGKWSFTISGQAWEAWRRRFLPNSKTVLVHGHGPAVDLERAAHYGGLCQVWFRGEIGTHTLFGDCSRNHGETPAIRPAPVYYLDANSFYPAIMRAHRSPVKLLELAAGVSLCEVNARMRDQGAIADVKIETDGAGFPVRRKDGTYYCRGKFRTQLAGPELQRAIDEGAVRWVYAASFYEMRDIFSEFVDYFLLLRRKLESEGNPQMAFLVKLLTNSLYGKFAQRSGRWKDDPEKIALEQFGFWYDYDFALESSVLYRSLNWFPQRQVHKGEGWNSCPAIAAYVTAHGRERILALRQIAGIEDCYYSDTDSLHCSHDAYKRLVAAGEVDPHFPGKLKTIAVANSAYYRGQKCYEFGGKFTVAGRKAEAEQIDACRFSQIFFPRASSIFNLGGLNEIPVTTRIVDISRETVRGKILPCGTVLPVTLDE